MKSLEQFIDQVMKENGLSFIGLVNKLGYRSKTSLQRIIKGTVRPDTIRKFEQAMLSAFELSTEEKGLLSEIVQKLVYGEEQYWLNQEIMGFIQGNDVTEKDLRITDLRTGCEVDLNARYDGLRELHLTIVNCQYVNALFNCVHRLLQRKNASVQHFIYVDDNDVRTIRSVSTLMPIFYENSYVGYTRRRRPLGQEQDSGLNESDWLIVSLVDSEGEKSSEMILFSGSASGTLMEMPFMDEEHLKLMGLDRQLYKPIKRNYFDCIAFEDYITYSENYAALERDHSIWKIKPDVGVDQIPAWILVQAVREGPVPPDDQFAEVLDKLGRIYIDRYKNSFAKHKHCYTVFKRGAMRRFAMTGKTTDHFWMMRPFIPKERVVILSELLKQQENNPYVHFYFLKDDATLRDVEIAYYEGEGMLILDSETDYNLEQGHSEVLITHERMLSLFKEFFMNQLLQEYVCAESETIVFLRHLIFEVEAMEKG